MHTYLYYLPMSLYRAG